MYAMSNPLFLLSLSILGFGCSNAPEVENLRWLSGTWEQRNGAQLTSETWSYSDSGILTGHSETTQQGEMLFSEELSILDSNGVIVYVAVLPFKTALFTLDSIGQGYVRFIDLSNDFPNSIAYQRQGNNLDVTLLGNQNGEHVRDVLSFILLER